MRWRLLTLFLAITAGLAIVQFEPPKVVTSHAGFVATRAAIICPDSARGATVVLGGQGTQLSPIGKLAKGVKELALTTSKDVTSARISSVAHLVENSVGGATQIDTAAGLSGLACPTVDPSYWFVGGSAALSGQDRLVLVNAGHGDAAATVLAWSDKGPVPAYPVVVPAQTSIRVGLDSIAPGVNAIVLHVLIRSGRVAASLYDQRSQGLTNLGADFVPSGIEPAKRFVMLGVPGINPPLKSSAKPLSSKVTSETRVLRLLAPMNAASVRVDVVGPGDSFTPLGLDKIELVAGRVRDIPITTNLPALAYAFVVTADSPVVAGVFSSVIAGKGSDIAWTASAPSLSLGAASADIHGTTYLFYSHAAVSVSVTRIRVGAIPITSTLAIPAETVVVLPPGNSSNLGNGATSIRIGENVGVVYAARLLRSINGITTSPLRPISVAGRSSMPIADVGVGMPR